VYLLTDHWVPEHVEAFAQCVTESLGLPVAQNPAAAAARAQGFSNAKGGNPGPDGDANVVRAIAMDIAIAGRSEKIVSTYGGSHFGAWISDEIKLQHAGTVAENLANPQFALSQLRLGDGTGLPI
jgi:hypothetical protein